MNDNEIKKYNNLLNEMSSEYNSLICFTQEFYDHFYLSEAISNGEEIKCQKEVIELRNKTIFEQNEEIKKLFDTINQQELKIIEYSQEKAFLFYLKICIKK